MKNSRLSFLTALGSVVLTLATFGRGFADEAAVRAPQALPASTFSALQKLIAAPELADARLGVSIVALGKVDKVDEFPSRPYAGGEQPVLFSNDADKRFTPASNMKLYTAALALSRLGAAKTFSTQVVCWHKMKDGELFGPLQLRGNGDPSLDVDGLRALARAVAKRGVRKVRGVEDGSVTSGLHAENLGGRYPDGWTLDDALWYYGPEVSPLTFHRNQLDVIFTGGEKEGDAAQVELEPGFPQFQLQKDIVSYVTTGGKDLASMDGEDLLLVDRPLATYGKLAISITGKVAPRQKVTIGIAVPNPAEWAVQVFRQELERAGVVVLDTKPDPSQKLSDSGFFLSEFLHAQHDSPPLGELLKQFLKTSDNLYGELLWRQAGGGKDSPTRTADTARPAMQEFVKNLGIDPAGMRFSDGSGLSRYNLITPRATTQLLAGIERLPGGDSLWNALPIAGVDGTLKKRMIGTVAAGNVRAKTGTFSIVSCLSGYVTTKDGQRLAVSVLTNFARNGSDARVLQNNIFSVLAGADFSEATVK